MNEKEIRENNCKHCRHYVEHYIIMSTQFYPIGGHCVNKKLYNPHKKYPYCITANCTEWESDENKRTKTIKSTAEVLRSIERHLFYMSEILRIYGE